MKSAYQHNQKWHGERLPILQAQQNLWLFRPGALTAGLRQLGRVDLRVLNEYAEGLPQDETAALQRPRHSAIWVREVAMAINGADCVVARSATPLAASHGVWQGMRRLRTRPLADMLYHEPGIRRSAFSCCRPDPSMPIYHTATGVCEARRLAPSRHRLLVRRSTFWRNGQPLMVAECFLPAFWERLR